MPRSPRGKNATDAAEVLVAGESFGTSSDGVHLNVFVAAGEKRRADDPVVLRSRGSWHREGERAAWHHEHNQALAEAHAREAEEWAATQKKHAPERAVVMGWRLRGFGAHRSRSGF